MTPADWLDRSAESARPVLSRNLRVALDKKAGRVKIHGKASYLSADPKCADCVKDSSTIPCSRSCFCSKHVFETTSS